MKSQLQILQERVNQARSRMQNGDAPSGSARAQTFCVTSGKGGVGKTAFSINFALTLAGMNKRVVIVDSDFGFSNVNLMLGKTSQYSLADVLAGQRRLEDVMEESYRNVWYISGGSGVAELMSLGGTELELILAQLAVLEERMDFIIFDTGAGINDNILRLMETSDSTILVTTPEPTSVLDSYVVLKAASDLSERPVVSVLVNKANSEGEAESTFKGLSTVAGTNLGYRLSMLGYIPADSRITKSIKAMVPFMIQYPGSGTSVQLKRIAEKIVQPGALGAVREGGIRGFFRRLARGRRT